jgi:predicted aspartyl protease
MFAYDRAFDPPAPFVDVRVSRPVEPAAGQPVRAKLDTGADLSCIPTTLANQLGLLPARRVLVEGYDGEQTSVVTYTITLEVADARFRYLEVIAIPEEYALLGRDVLNSFYVDLRGPDLTFRMSVSS